ncbi:MAG: ankyrin repeat domain-containing protein [Elusimicrobiota bacterium]|jgi:ankyrin repeat protein|nr:ankyrin repeat domain-containing protein [Elusimicrobiota bacterium]
MKFPKTNKITIAIFIMLPIVLLTAYTIISNRTSKRSKKISAEVLNYRTPSQTSDEIAAYIENDDYETARVKIDELLKDPNIPTSRGITLLVLAAQKNNYGLVAVLLDKGSNPNLPDQNDGETALIKASRNGHIDMMNMLIIANADPNQQSRRGTTPLTAAIQNGSPMPVTFLMSNGARAGASQDNMLRYAFQKKFVGVDAMLKAGINPNFADANGNTPLIVSVSYGDLQSAQALIDYRADVNAANASGMTALLYAIQTKNTEMISLLIDRNADINKANKNGETPLFWAAYLGDTQLVDELLKLGADYKKTTKNKMTALQIAQRNKHTKTAKLIKDFIAYQNIPRDAKGNPIIPKGKTKEAASGNKAKTAPAPSKKTNKQQMPAAESAMPDDTSMIPAIPGMPAGFNPAEMSSGGGFPSGALPSDMSDYQQFQQQQNVQQKSSDSSGKGKLRTSKL